MQTLGQQLSTLVGMKRLRFSATVSPATLFTHLKLVLSCGRGIRRTSRILPTTAMGWWVGE
jgi:hypothetical protein